MTRSGLRANWGLYKSRHAVVAALLVAGAIGWGASQGFRFGSRDPDNVVYLLTTGWLSVALFVALALYAVRKAAHRTGLSPEFRRKLPLRTLEQAATSLQQLENEARGGLLIGRGALEKKASKLLREAGAHRVLRAEVATVRGAVQVRAVPRNSIGRLASWLHAHVFYGVAAAVLVVCHGGGRMGSTMGLWLNLLSFVVIASGLVGILLWTFGPSWLTRQERELSVEQALALEEHYARKVREGLAALEEKGPVAGVTDAARQAVQAGALLGARDAQAMVEAMPPELATLVQQRQRVGREWLRLKRARSWLGGWRILHVPLSVVLLALVVVHIFGVWVY